MRCHIIGTLGGVAETRVAVAYQRGEKCFEIAPHIGIGILAHDQRRASVVNKDIAKTDRNAAARNDLLYVARQLIRPATMRRDAQRILMHGHLTRILHEALAARVPLG